MSVPLIFKNERGVVQNFADEVVLHETTEEFKNATPVACKGMRYGELQHKGDTKLSKVESRYVGTLYCSTMQKLLRKGLVYVTDKTTGQHRKLFSGELLLADPDKSFLHRRWKKENRCALYTTVRADLAAAPVPTITVTTEKGKRWKVRKVVWNQVHLTKGSEAAFAAGAHDGSPGIGLGTTAPPCVSPGNLAGKTEVGGSGPSGKAKDESHEEGRSAFDREASYDDGLADDEDDKELYDDDDDEEEEEEEEEEGETDDDEEGEDDTQEEDYYYECKEAPRWMLQGENRALQQEMSALKKEFRRQLGYAMDETEAWRGAYWSANNQIASMEKLLDGHVEKNKVILTELIRKHEAEKAEQARKQEVEKAEQSKKYELEKAQMKKREHDLLELQTQLKGSNKRLRRELEESGAKCRGLEAKLAELQSERLPQGRESFFARMFRRVLGQGADDSTADDLEPHETTGPTQSRGLN